ncbi:MAG: glycine betaine ABC transporter substrate-binding protein [Candidatus Bipolaricaulia bacterium]
MKKIVSLLLVFLLMASLSGIAVAQKGRITVGSKGFTEQLIVGNMMAILLEENGYDVDYRASLGTVVAWGALTAGQIDVYMEYTGTAWLVHLGHTSILPREEEYQKVRAESAELGLLWLNDMPINNTYALAMREDQAEALGIETLSDLAEYVRNQEGRVSLASDFEFYSRPDGVIGLMKEYEFAFHPAQIKTMAFGLTHQALKEERVDVAMVFGTDAQNARFNFRVLEDDQNFFPVYDLAPVIRQEVANRHPEVVRLLNRLVATIPDADTMRELNAMVDIDKRDPEDVAQEWLEQHGLI